MNTIIRTSLLVALLGVVFATQLRAQLPNAWQIDDPAGTPNSTPHYTTNLPAGLQSAATNSSGGFRFTINARFVADFGGSKSMAMAYGLGSKRFLIWFELNGTGDLIAELEGAGTHVLTTNGTGTVLYHTHEITFFPGTGKASYAFDGQVKTINWSPSAITFPSGQIYWGAGSSLGLGLMNFHSVQFEVTDMVVARYDAGTEPTNAPDPQTQGWTYALLGVGTVSGVSPDSVPLPTLPSSTTLGVAGIEPHQAIVSGVVNQGNQAPTTWFEWGTTTNYGNSSWPVQLLSDTNDFNISATITGLAKGTVYHYRCVATNLQGISYGGDATFTTPSVFIVTSRADSGDGSLRQSIAHAQSGDIITFATNGILTLTSAELLITNDLTIVGPGPTDLVVSGNNARRVLNIAAGSTVGISGVAIMNGLRPNGAIGVAGGGGGGIFNFGALTLSNCIVSDNHAGNGGVGSSPSAGGGGTGGAGGNGGGIYNAGSGDLTLIGCTVANNRAGNGGNGGKGGNGIDVFTPNGATGGSGGRGGWGGGIYNDSGSVNLIACTFNQNVAGAGGQGGTGGNGLLLGNGGPGGNGGTGGHGGGTYKNNGILSLVSCTFYGNSTGGDGTGGTGGTAGTGGNPGATGGRGDGGNGAGTYNNIGSLTLINCTFSQNNFIGIYNLGTLVLTNSIVDDPIYGPFSGVNNFTNFNPQLSPLGNYGGLTQTVSPQPGSPVIDAGDDSVTNFLSTDQRGYSRRVGAHVDIGAMEYLPLLVVTTNADSGLGSLREAVPPLGWGGVITFSSNLDGQIITLTSGELLIAKSLTIAGPGREMLAINGNGQFTIFRIGDGRSFGQEVILDSLTLTNGYTSTHGGGIYLDSGATLTVSNCAVVGNSAGSGGGIYSVNRDATTPWRLSLMHSTLSGNSAITNGGGVYSGGPLTLIDSTIFGNSSGSGGGIYAVGYLTLIDSTLLGNSARRGGGIYVGNQFGLGDIMLTNSTLSGNSATDGDGGGIHNTGNTTVRLEYSTLAGNTATTNGGGIFTINSGSLMLKNSMLTGNSAGYGGGIYSRDASYSTLTDSTLAGNFATRGNGGGIHSSGFNNSITLERSTLSDNSAVTNGGGIYVTNSSNLTLKNSTLAGNSADSGGGIYNAGDYTHARLEHSTLSGNQAGTTGGGIYQSSSGGSTLSIANTIVAGNVAAVSPDMHAGNPNQISLSGNNLTNGIPLLAPLGDYGGPTQTMPPLSGSPAIDAGNDSIANWLATDQRGYPRLSGTHADIGAAESHGASTSNSTPLMITAVQANGALTVAFTNAPNADFTVMASTNVAQSFRVWTPLGLATQVAPGQYQFTDLGATNHPQRFYRLISP